MVKSPDFRIRVQLLCETGGGARSTRRHTVTRINPRHHALLTAGEGFFGREWHFVKAFSLLLSRRERPGEGSWARFYRFAMLQPKIPNKANQKFSMG